MTINSQCSNGVEASRHSLRELRLSEERTRAIGFAPFNNNVEPALSLNYREEHYLIRFKAAARYFDRASDRHMQTQSDNLHYGA